MVLDAADLKCRHIVRPSHAPDVGPHALLDVGVDQRLAVFCAEDEVVEEGGVGVRHILADVDLNVFNRREAAGSCSRSFPWVPPTYRGLHPRLNSCGRYAARWDSLFFNPVAVYFEADTWPVGAVNMRASRRANRLIP